MQIAKLLRLHILRELRPVIIATSPSINEEAVGGATIEANVSFVFSIKSFITICHISIY